MSNRSYSATGQHETVTPLLLFTFYTEDQVHYNRSRSAPADLDTLLFI